jgi:hypothetical protein
VNRYEVSPAAWFVPSANVPGDYYRVEIAPDGATSCSCHWGRNPKAPSKCWHVRLVLAIETDYVRHHLPGLYERACAGDVIAVVRILSGFGDELAQADALHNAGRCFETIAKYMQAISVQGAAVDITEEALAASPAMVA